jgi:hypothetical protein
MSSGETSGAISGHLVDIVAAIDHGLIEVAISMSVSACVVRRPEGDGHGNARLGRASSSPRSRPARGLASETPTPPA